MNSTNTTGRRRCHRVTANRPDNNPPTKGHQHRVMPPGGATGSPDRARTPVLMRSAHPDVRTA